jgi:hypothetical protein
MKTALLLSGLPRFWRTCLPTQMAMFAPGEVDVFFHFWDVLSAGEKDAIVDQVRPKAYRFEPLRDFSAFDRNPNITPDKINVPSRLASQYASWKGVAELFAPYRADYPFAMRSRSDLQFVRSIAPALAELGPNAIMLYWAVPGRQVSDVFAVGGSDVILTYLRLFDRLENYAAEVEFNPEILLTHHLEQILGVRVLTQTTPTFFIRRAHMENASIDACLAEDPGFNKWQDPELVACTENYFRARQGEDGVRFVHDFAAKAWRTRKTTKNAG